MSAVGDARKRLAEVNDTAPGSDWPHIISAADLEQIKRDAWQEGWEHHRSTHPHDPTFAVNPYGGAA